MFFQDCTCDYQKPVHKAILGNNTHKTRKLLYLSLNLLSFHNERILKQLSSAYANFSLQWIIPSPSRCEMVLQKIQEISLSKLVPIRWSSTNTKSSFKSAMMRLCHVRLIVACIQIKYRFWSVTWLNFLRL